jgi:hypothetical protein
VIPRHESAIRLRLRLAAAGKAIRDNREISLFPRRFEKLAVIGDKSKSAQDVTWLTSRPGLLDRMAALTGARIRMMHVIRNPFDIIATRSVRRKLPLEKISSEYFALCDRLVRLIQRLDSIRI